MKLKLTFNGKSTEVEIDPKEDTFESLIILSTAEFETDTSVMKFLYKNQSIYNGTNATAAQDSQAPLSKFNFAENDVIAVSNNNTSSAPVQQQQQPASSAAAADQELLRLFGNPAAGAASRPAPAPAPTTTSNNNSNNADQELLNMFRQGLGGGAPVPAQQQQQGMGQRMNSDDPEVQRRILEAIQRQNIEENLQNAMEHTPEAFARVTMLYIPCEVNHHQMAAFIDSGAQMTVMSEETAEKCNISHLIDRRYAGMAHGVGTTKIVGRVHLTTVMVAGQHLPMSITILAAKNMDFLIGLDQLKRHQMLVDLKNNELRIDETHAVKFLGEGELPEHLKDGIPRHASTGAPDLDAMAEEGGAEKKKTDADDSKNKNDDTSAPPQRRPADQPSSASAGSQSTAATSQNLTQDQQNMVKQLSETFGVPQAVALQTLRTADWNAEVAANLILSMTS